MNLMNYASKMASVLEERQKCLGLYVVLSAGDGMLVRLLFGS